CSSLCMVKHATPPRHLALRPLQLVNTKDIERPGKFNKLRVACIIRGHPLEHHIQRKEFVRWMLTEEGQLREQQSRRAIGIQPVRRDIGREGSGDRLVWQYEIIFQDLIIFEKCSKSSIASPRAHVAIVVEYPH